MFGKLGQKISETIAPKISKAVGGEVAENSQVKNQIYSNDVSDEVVNKSISDAGALPGDGQLPPPRERMDQYVNPARTNHRNFSLEYINTSDDVLRYMDDLSENIGDEVGAKSKNVQTHGETLKQADNDINGAYSLDDILNSGRYLNRKPGNWTAGQLTAGRKMLVTGAEELHEMATTLAGKSEADVTDAEIYAFRKGLATYQALKRSVEGGVNEAARIVNSMRIPVGSPQAMGMQVQEKLNELGGREVGLKMARGVALTGGDAKKVSDFSDKFSTANVADAMFEHWLGLGLLSDPMTHKVNLTGNSGAMLLGIGEAYAATAVGKAKALILKAAGKPDADIQYHTLDQANAYAYGMAQALPQVWSIASKTFREADDAAMGLSRDMSSAKTGATHSPKWKAETFGVNSNSKFGSMIDWWGKNVTRMSFRMLEAEDEAFKFVAKTMERNRMTYRVLESEGLKPGTDEFNKRSAQIISGNDPVYSAQVDDASDAWARYQTFTDEADDAFTRGASSISNARLMGIPFMKGFIPFMKILTNLTTYSLERTPIAMLMPKWREQFSKGGADKDIAVAKMGIGVLATWQINEMMTGKAVDKDGNLVARPQIIGSGFKQWSENSQMKQVGLNKYSIVIDGKSHDVSRLSPIGQTFVNITSTLEAVHGLYDEEEKQTYLAAVAVGVGEAMADQTFFQGFSDFVAIANGDQDFDEWMARNAASFVVPNVVNRTRKFSDDQTRYKKHDDFFESVRLKVSDRLPSEVANLFGLKGSEDLPLRYTPLGEPILNDEMGWQKWSPMNLTQWTMIKQPYSSEDANIFLQALKIGYTIPNAKPSFTVKVRSSGGMVSQKVDLNMMDQTIGAPLGSSYSKWSKLLGEQKKKAFVSLLSSQAWSDAGIRDADRNGRYELMRKASNKASQIARKMYQDQNKEMLKIEAQRLIGKKKTGYTLPEGVKDNEVYKTTQGLKL